MQDSIQKSHQILESSLENLYERLLKVKNLKEQKQVLEEIETVIGVRLIYE